MLPRSIAQPKSFKLGSMERLAAQTLKDCGCLERVLEGNPGILNTDLKDGIKSEFRVSLGHLHMVRREILADRIRESCYVFLILESGMLAEDLAQRQEEYSESKQHQQGMLF